MNLRYSCRDSNCVGHNYDDGGGDGDGSGGGGSGGDGVMVMVVKRAVTRMMAGHDSANCDGSNGRDHGGGNDDHIRGLPSLFLDGLSLGRIRNKGLSGKGQTKDGPWRMCAGHLACPATCWEPCHEFGAHVGALCWHWTSS